MKLGHSDHKNLINSCPNGPRFNRPREDLRREAEAKRKLSAEELEKLRDADGRARDEFKVVTKTYKEADHLVGLGLGPE